MADIRPDRMNETETTDDERAALEAAGFELAKNFHDYGNGDLLNALRIGYALGWADHGPAPEGEAADPRDDLPDGFVFHGPADLAERIVTALSQPRPQVRKARKLGRVLADALREETGR